MIFSALEGLLRCYAWSGIPEALVNHAFSKLVIYPTLGLLSNGFMILHFIFSSRKGARTASFTSAISPVLPNTELAFSAILIRIL